MYRSGFVLAFTLSSALTLAACSSQPDQAPSPSPNDTAQAPVDEPSAEVGAPTTAASALADAHSIPPLLRGRWGLVPLDCTGDPAAAKGLITIDPARIEFYESVAKLGTIDEIGESSVRAAFQFEGEGQTWDLNVSLASLDGGKTLVRTDRGADAAPGPLTYTKCP